MPRAQKENLVPRSTKNIKNTKNTKRYNLVTVLLTGWLAASVAGWLPG